MNDQQLQLLEQTHAYVSDLFHSKIDSYFPFHNLGHTQEVLAAAEELAAHYNLPEDDELVLMLAAWFHDTGFSIGIAEEHEKESIRIATEFLNKQEAGPELIQRVSSAIQATRMPQSPLSLVEKILCDADLFHLGSSDFKKKTAILKNEQENYYKKEISKKEWRQRNIEFLEEHQYFTEYAQQKREPQKQEWLKELRKKQGTKEVKHTDEMEISPYSYASSDLKKEMKTGPSVANRNVERGIQTVFRVTANNHINLSQMADSKAGLMISVNAIIISIMFSVLLGRLEYYPHLAIPTLILAVVCVATIIFSVLATRPTVSAGRFTEDDIRNKRTNLLFFGNFHRMDLEEYNWAMGEMLKDREYVYGSMVKDIYFLGVVLARKYYYLRISYNIFMYGLITSVIAFGIASFMGI